MEVVPIDVIVSNLIILDEDRGAAPAALTLLAWVCDGGTHSENIQRSTIKGVIRRSNRISMDIGGRGQESNGEHERVERTLALRNAKSEGQLCTSELTLASKVISSRAAVSLLEIAHLLAVSTSISNVEGSSFMVRHVLVRCPFAQLSKYTNAVRSTIEY